MRKHSGLVALAFVAIAASAQPAEDLFAQIGVQIKGPLKELAGLDEQEKELRRSEEAQIVASAAEKKQRARIQSDVTALQIEGESADRMRARVIASGCPEHGGEVPIGLAERCNPLVREHAALVAKLTQRAAALRTQIDTVNQLQASISATVMNNVQKRKTIEGRRAPLMAERDRLQSLAVAEAIRRDKLAAARACRSECCHRVIYDGADPKLCGLGLVCQSFQSGGLFGRGNMICAAGPSAAPVR